MDRNLLHDFPLHLSLDGAVVALEQFTGQPDWYMTYEKEWGADGASGRLVSWHSFDRSWDSWEMHPIGDEVVLCVEGSIELVQEIDGAEVSTTLGQGQWAVNPAGTWHTADMREGVSATCVFITSGFGTQHRPR